MASLDEKEETLVLQKLLETAKKSNIFLRGLEKNGEISLLLVFWTTIAIWAFGFIQNEALKVGPIDTLGFVVICVMLLPFVSLLIGHFYGWAYWKNVRYARLEEYLTTDFQTRLMQWRVAREKAQTAKTEMQEAFNQAEAEIRNENEKIRLQNQTALDEWQPRYNQWEERKAEFDRQNKIQEEEFYARQSERNSEIDERRAKYLQCDESEVTKYCEAVLQSSFYPKPFDKREFDLEYHSEGKLLIVEYSFPAIDALPRVEEVKYIKSRDELRESEISASQLAQMFDTAVYSVTLSSLYRLFSMDAAGALGTISFN